MRKVIFCCIVSTLLVIPVSPAFFLSSKSTQLSSQKVGNPSTYTTRFTMERAVTSGTIQIDLSNAVANINNLSATHVEIMYGPAGSEVEYLVQDIAGDGVWGASINAQTKVATLTYPASNGTSIAIGDRVIIGFGIDLATTYPIPPASSSSSSSSTSSTTTSTTSQIVINSPTVESPTRQLSEAPTIEVAPSILQVDLGATQSLLQDQLAAIRSITESLITAPLASLVVPVAETPPPSTETRPKDVSDTQAQKDDDTIHTIILAEPKHVVVSPEQETIVSLSRSDEAHLTISIPQQVIAQNSRTSAPVSDGDRTNDTYTFDVKPLTLDQAAVWTQFTLPADIAVSPTNVFLVTAYAKEGDAIAPISAFLNPITYTVYYTDEDVRGIDINTLSLYSWSPAERVLRKEPSIIDTARKTITASVDHLTLFFLAGERVLVAPSAVRVSPSVRLQRQVAKIGSMKGTDLVLEGGVISVRAGSRVEVCIPNDVFPKAPKRITFQIGSDVIDARPVTLRACQLIQFTAPADIGRRVATLRITYLDDQVQTISYRLLVSSDFAISLRSVAPPVAAVANITEEANAQIKDAIVRSEPVLQTTAVAAGPVIAAMNPGFVAAIPQAAIYFNHFISTLLTALGLRKRRRSWGLVYDSITKSPVDLAIVRLLDTAGKLIETQVTDREGRFSFVPRDGSYTIGIQRAPYLFPSSIFTGTTDPSVGPIYHGGLFDIKGSELTAEFNIPIDPPNPDHKKASGLHSATFTELYTRSTKYLLLASLVVSIILSLYSPSILNLALLLVNSLFTIMQSLLYMKKERPWGMIFDSQTLAPLSLSAVTLIDAASHKIVRTRLSDYDGRFSFLVTPGQYVVATSKTGYVSDVDAHAPRKLRPVYDGGVLAVKRKGSTIRLNIAMEKKI